MFRPGQVVMSAAQAEELNFLLSHFVSVDARGTASNQSAARDLIPVAITAVTDVSGVYAYTWAEQVTNSTGQWEDKSGGMTGSSTFQPAYEANNLHLTVFPFFTTLRRRVIIPSLGPVFEFGFGGDAYSVPDAAYNIAGKINAIGSSTAQWLGIGQKQVESFAIGVSSGGSGYPMVYLDSADDDACTLIVSRAYDGNGVIGVSTPETDTKAGNAPIRAKYLDIGSPSLSTSTRYKDASFVCNHDPGGVNRTFTFQFDYSTGGNMLTATANSYTDGSNIEIRAYDYVRLYAYDGSTTATVEANPDDIKLVTTGVDGIKFDSLKIQVRANTGAYADGYSGSSGGTTFLNGIAITGGGGGSYTNEDAQDAVGGILVDSATINLTYTDGTPEITAAVVDGSITTLQLADDAVTADKLEDAGVTLAKLAPDVLAYIAAH